MSKLNKIEKLYGKDFGVRSSKKIVKYLRSKGYPSLAKLLEEEK